MKEPDTHEGIPSWRTRRLAACNQAVVILGSTSYIWANCFAFEVVRNSMESMCSSYSPFDCISWNRLIAYHSFADLKHVKWVKIVISAYKRFSLFSLAFVVVAVCFFPFLKKERHFKFQSNGGAWHRPTNVFAEKHIHISWFLAHSEIKVLGKVFM